MRSLKLALLLAVVLVLVTAQTSAAQTTCQVYPPQPTDSAACTVMVSGTWSDSCAPRRATVEVLGNTIYMTLYRDQPQGTYCAMVISDYCLTAKVGPLPAGQYTLRAMLADPAAPPPYGYYMPLCTSTFTVTPGLPVDCGWPENVTIDPPAPAWNTPIEITVSGQCGTSCIPQSLNVSVAYGRVDVDVLVPEYSACPSVVTPWILSQGVNPLGPGEYKIFIHRNGLPGEGYPMGSFYVRPGPYVTSVYSVKQHGTAGRLTVDLRNGSKFEPRRGGPTEVYVEFSKDIYAVTGVLDTTSVRVSGASLAALSRSTSTRLRLDLASPVQGTVTLDFVGICDVDGVPLQQQSITIVGLLGDATGDGRVDVADLSMIKAFFGKPVWQYPRCDLTLSGKIDVADLSMCKSQFPR